MDDLSPKWMAIRIKIDYEQLKLVLPQLTVHFRLDLKI